MSVDHHALFLTGGLQTVSGNSDAWRGNDEKFHTRIGCRELEDGGLSGIREIVRETNAGFARAKSIGDGVFTISLFNGGLRDGHAAGGGRGDLLEHAFFWNDEIEIAFGA